MMDDQDKKASKDFENAFAAFAEDTPPDAAGPEVTGDRAGDDIWAGADAAQRAAYEAAIERAERAEQAAKSDSGRISSFQNQVAELKARLEAAENVSAMRGATPAREAGSAALAGENPELEPVLAHIQAIEAQNRDLAIQVATLSNLEQGRQTTSQYEALAARHPDWHEHAGTPDFINWLDQQPAYVRQAAERNGQSLVDAAEAAHLLDLYKAAYAAPPEQSIQAAADPKGDGDQETDLARRRARQLSGATSLPAGRVGAGSGAPDGFEAAFDYFPRRN